MRSRIHKLKPYDTVDIAAYRTVFVPDEAQIAYEMNRLRNPYIRWEAGSVPRRGDMATCDLSSALPRFNRLGVQMIVGSGMLSAELDEALLGMHAGETKEILIGQEPVEVTLTEVRSKLVPELTDAMAEAAGIEGVRTIAQYREYLIGKQKRERVEEEGYEAVNHVLNTVRSESEFILFQEDLEKIVSLRVERCKTLCKQDGLVFEEMTEEEFAAGRVPGVRSYEGVIALERYYAWDNLQSSLLGMHYAEADGVVIDEAAYQQYLDEYVRSWGVTPEQARESNPLDYFCTFEYGGYFMRKVLDYVAENYFVEE